MCKARRWYDKKLAWYKWYPRHYRSLLHRVMISTYNIRSSIIIAILCADFNENDRSQHSKRSSRCRILLTQRRRFTSSAEGISSCTFGTWPDNPQLTRVGERPRLPPGVESWFNFPWHLPAVSPLLRTVRLDRHEMRRRILRRRARRGNDEIIARDRERLNDGRVGGRRRGCIRRRVSPGRSTDPPPRWRVFLRRGSRASRNCPRETETWEQVPLRARGDPAMLISESRRRCS